MEEGPCASTGYAQRDAGEEERVICRGNGRGRILSAAEMGEFGRLAGPKKAVYGRRISFAGVGEVEFEDMGRCGKMSGRRFAAEEGGLRGFVDDGRFVEDFAGLASLQEVCRCRGNKVRRRRSSREVGRRTHPCCA